MAERTVTGQEPGFIHEYFAALDAGQGAMAADMVATDAKMILPPGPDGVRPCLEGHEIREMLEARGAPAWTHEIDRALDDQDTWIVEGSVRGGGADAMFLLVVTVDEQGLIARYDAYRTALVPPATSKGVRVSAEEALAHVRGLFERLQEDPGFVPLPGEVIHVEGPETSDRTGDTRVAMPQNPRLTRVAASEGLVLGCGTADHPDGSGVLVEFAMSLEVSTEPRIPRMVLLWAPSEGVASE